jgi:hypothetical protein
LFRASKRLQKFRTQKARNKVAKMKIVCEPVGIGGWTSISTWITPLFIEFSPFHVSRNDKRVKILFLNNGTRNLSSSLTSERTLLELASETSHVAKPSYPRIPPYQCYKKMNSKKIINRNIKTMSLSKDMIDPKEIAT